MGPWQRGWRDPGGGRASLPSAQRGLGRCPRERAIRKHPPPTKFSSIGQIPEIGPRSKTTLSRGTPKLPARSAGRPPHPVLPPRLAGMGARGICRLSSVLPHFSSSPQGPQTSDPGSPTPHLPRPRLWPSISSLPPNSWVQPPTVSSRDPLSWVPLLCHQLETPPRAEHPCHRVIAAACVQRRVRLNSAPLTCCLRRRPLPGRRL